MVGGGGEREGGREGRCKWKWRGKSTLEFIRCWLSKALWRCKGLYFPGRQSTNLARAWATVLQSSEYMRRHQTHLESTEGDIYRQGSDLTQHFQWNSYSDKSLPSYSGSLRHPTLNACEVGRQRAGAGSNCRIALLMNICFLCGR